MYGGGRIPGPHKAFFHDWEMMWDGIFPTDTYAVTDSREKVELKVNLLFETFEDLRVVTRLIPLARPK